MTQSQLDLKAIRQWCGKDLPLSFDIEVQFEGERKTWGYELPTSKEQEQALTKKGSCVLGEIASSWDEVEAMCKKSAKRKFGFRIVAITDYTASHPIIYHSSNS